MSRLIRLTVVAGALAALIVPLAASAHGGKRVGDDDRHRLLYTTDTRGNLLSFAANNPRRVRSTAITGLPGGVALRGIDFRPATGDLYGVGSDSVVYRVNPRTGIAVAEGPAFTPALSGNSFGVDFNPTVDKIRVVSDAGQNLRLNVDEGTALSQDQNINPGMPQVVGSAYTNSSFTATKPAATTLYAVDAASDRLFVQNPPNNGTLTMGQRLGIDVGPNAGFDIAGADNVGFLTNAASRRGTTLYTVDLQTGKTRSLGRVGGGKRLVLTGLAAWQD
ncbi:MAG TPA: DUF4394 domain-containing protein [Solirubrobacteraceae bacterium]